MAIKLEEDDGFMDVEIVELVEAFERLKVEFLSGNDIGDDAENYE